MCVEREALKKTKKKQGVGGWSDDEFHCESNHLGIIAGPVAKVCL